MLTKAVHEIMYPGDKRHDDPVLDYGNADDTEFVTTSDPLKQYAVCLLRKASVSVSINYYAYLNIDSRPPEYIHHTCTVRSSILWRVPANPNCRTGTNAADDDNNGRKVEFFYTKDYSPGYS